MMRAIEVIELYNSTGKILTDFYLKIVILFLTVNF